jgi:hypothetical protein
MVRAVVVHYDDLEPATRGRRIQRSGELFHQFADILTFVECWHDYRQFDGGGLIGCFDHQYTAGRWDQRRTGQLRLLITRGRIVRR